MNIHHISPYIRRTLLTLAAVIAVALTSQAQVSTTLQCKYPELVDTYPPGSSLNPFVISTEADLRELQSNQALWGKLKSSNLPLAGYVTSEIYYYFEQTDDITFAPGATPLGPIGTGPYSDTSQAYNAVYKPFVGRYNGNGHSITNLVIDWSTVDKNHIAFGMFGSLADAEIVNLVLDHAVATRLNVANPAAKIDFDVKIGLIAGMAVKSAVHNVQIINSEINDGGFHTPIQSLFVGAVIGDISSGFSGYDIMSNQIYGEMNLDNLYVEADILLDDVEHFYSNDNRVTQFNVGGIVGRYRRSIYENLPTNCFFSGAIKAPCASISPTWGLVRANASSLWTYMYKAYAGEVTKNPTITGTSIADANLIFLDTTIEYMGNTINVDENRYYSDYSVYDYSTDEYVAFDGTGIDAVNVNYGCRTLAGSTGIPTTTVDVTNRNLWRHVQGVNHATYIDLNTNDGKRELLKMLQDNANANANSDFMAWGITDDGIRLGKAPYIHVSRTDIDELTIEVLNMAEQNVSYDVAAVDFQGNTTTLASNVTRGIEFPLTIEWIEQYDYLSVTARPELTPDNVLTSIYNIPAPTGSITYDSLTQITGQLIPSYPDTPLTYYWHGILYDGTEEDLTSHSPVLEIPVNTYDVIYLGYGSPLERFGNYVASINVPGSAQAYIIEVTTTTNGTGGLRYVASVYDSRDHSLVMGGTPTDEHPEGYVAPGFENYGWKWQVGSDPASSQSWEGTLGTFGHCYIDPFQQGIDRNRFYRVTWGPLNETASDVANYSQGIGGSRKVIFVYDKAKTELGRSLRVVNSAHKPVYINGTNQYKYFTTFDGINHYTDSYGNQHNDPYPDGDDRNTGYDPLHAVKTLKRAYELLDGAPGTDVDDNVIVIMGFYSDDNHHFLNYELNKYYDKPATITGKFGARIYDGALSMTNGNAINGYMLPSSPSYPMSLQAPLKFTEITWVGFDTPVPASETGLTATQLVINCNRNDFYLDENVYVVGYQDISNSNSLGFIKDTKSPIITLVAGNHNYKAGAEIPVPKYNRDGNWTTLDIQSGVLGRVIGAARNNSIAHGVYGTPENPHRVKIKISITHGADVHEYSPCNKYDFDIGLLTGGQTDGSTYTECEATIVSGILGRYISGNISYGRVIDGLPDDSFFGSSTLNLIGGSVRELYGGSLGRFDNGNRAEDNKVNGYFYGRSIINIDGADVHSYIYGAGAGGVAGVGTCRNHDWHHTNDEFIPYRTVTNDNPPTGSVLYGTFDDIAQLCPYDEDGNSINGTHVADYMPLFVLDETDEHGNHKTISLARAHCEINLISGNVYGNVYGGSHGYSIEANYQDANVQAGNVYGDTYVTIGTPGSSKTVNIYGSVYGGGSGDDTYYKAYVKDNPLPAEPTSQQTLNAFGMVARTFGDTNVTINSGYIEGDVFGGARGVAGQKYMATIYGNTSLTINGGTIMGNVFGGCDLALIDHRDDDPDHISSGNVTLTINDGTLGNNVFGGSQGSEDQESWIQGNVTTRILGGGFIGNPYINLVNGDDGYRTFNVYGGGYLNCEIEGDASLYMEKSLLVDEASVLNPHYPDDPDRFGAAFSDILFRRFCVYGGGHGVKTQVGGNASVTLNILGSEANKFTPTIGAEITRFHPGQMFFDVCGGGYSGNIGYWVNALGEPTADMDDPQPDDYVEYRNGNVTVMITGWPHIRKVVGGGFYSTVASTNTHIVSGNIQTAIGGALLGYVHNSADLFIGTIDYDYLTLMPKPTDGEGNELPDWTDEQKASAKQQSIESNSYLHIFDAVYGGNDVKGIVGTARWQPDVYDEEAREDSDGGPLFTADVTHDETKGVTLFVSGGTIKGNVYGAGNGNYRGYFVPGWLRYEDGPDRHYRKVLLPESFDAAGNLVNPTYGRVYRSRPMTGSVCIHIGGTKESPVVIEGDVFGGGQSCTIGQWNTILAAEDPRRLTAGGFLHLNIGSYVNIKGSLYVGVEGQQIARQYTVPKVGDVPVADLRTFDGTTTKALDQLGNIAYDHWYLSSTKHYYVPGFPGPGEVDVNTGMTGEHMFRGFLKNIEMNGDVELTFYADPYQRNPDGSIVTEIHDNGLRYRVRKHWVPGEQAASDYDSEKVYVTNIFAGGLSGSMSNNTEMLYDYTINKPITLADKANPDYASHDIEKYAAIYRYTFPAGVTVRDKIVGGSFNARNVAYAYNDDYTELITTRTEDDGQGGTIEVDNPVYVFEGGVVTQSLLTYDLIVYCDRNDILSITVPASVYTMDEADPDYYSHTMLHGKYAGTTIYRKSFPVDNNITNGSSLWRGRYSLATIDPEGTIAFTGERAERRGLSTAIKIAIGCKFAPQIDPSVAPSHVVIPGDDFYLNLDYATAGAESTTDAVEEDATLESTPVDYYYRYGGNIYGGCYNSGITMGDVIINVGSDIIGNVISLENAENFDRLSSLRYNLGRVFGGGFGADSRVDGDTYINLINNAKAMNVFGGGCRGNVAGKATINYIGNEGSAIFGAIYGGGLYGSVGYNDPEKEATEVNLISGNVDKVYGGSCLGNIYGRAHINITDEVFTAIDHIDYDKLIALPNFDPWATSRLIVGSVFGGNDISGNIYTLPFDPDSMTADELDTLEATGRYPDRYYSAIIDMREEPILISNPDDVPLIKNSPGAIESETHPGYWYSGFPLVGNIYGGSNGDYGMRGDGNKEFYTGGLVDFAIGEKATVAEINLGGADGQFSYPAFQLPRLDHTLINITGGTAINVFGGGNNSTIDKSTDIYLNYNPDNLMARAGFFDEAELIRIWNVMHLEAAEQRTEIISAVPVDDDKEAYVFDYQIYRMFGGNDEADMAIQPGWHLTRGYVGSLYSGGNIGAMTYFARDAERKPIGLSLHIDSRDFHANEVYGGGRIGDIWPNLDADYQDGDPDIDSDFYGASVHIDQGTIEHVYGGNDVSGTVFNGSKVVIRGAISGDVYCAGNGNYRYFYDPTMAADDIIEEHYDQTKGWRYFRLPQKPQYGGDNPNFAQRLLAINSYRPNVERSFMWIEGREAADPADNVIAYVHGNVYCGGNSSTVSKEPDYDLRPDLVDDDIRFKVGSHVMLNGVFLGSNGENLVDGDYVRQIADLNGIDLSLANDLTDDQTAELAANPLTARDAIAGDKSLYPTLLDIYMRAVDVTALPTDFAFDDDLEDVYIGDFFVGGNRGSMLTDQTIQLTFPETIVIYGKIVGGSNDANYTFNGVPHRGGLIRQLADDSPTDRKVHLTVKSRFEPWRLHYPVNGDFREIRRELDIESVDEGAKFYFPESKCNIYGGCLTSGVTVGGIAIDVFSDLVAEPTPGSELAEAFNELDGWTYTAANGSTASFNKRRVIVDGVNDVSRRSFAVIGAGYGERTSVIGDISVRLLPGVVSKTYVEGVSPKHPSVATIFGGSQMGSVIGNSTVKVRDGLVLTNMYGASEAAKLYGSTQTIIGWPEYYVSKVKREFTLDRTDKLSQASLEDWANAPTEAMPHPRAAVNKSIYLLPGEIISSSIFDFIADDDKTSVDVFEHVDNDLPHNFDAVHSTADHQYANATWDDIDIRIGDQGSREDNSAEYYGHGNIYGGGFISSSSSASLAGQYTVCAYNALNNPDGRLDSDLIGWGGNATILIADNAENADTTFEIGDVADTAQGGTGCIVRDHIAIGTSRYVPTKVVRGEDVMGKYVIDSKSRYIHQSPYVLGSDINPSTLQPYGDDDPRLQLTYYDIESDGGIYGGGRKVFTEGFRDCDISYYGYAGSTPQFPKMLNTIQRMDLLTVRDCCIHLEGANDFAGNIIDAKDYSLTRIGELRMLSSIKPTDALNPGVRESSGLYNIIHDSPRIRNYLAVFRDVHFVSAITSSEQFSQPFRGANGQLHSLGDYDVTESSPEHIRHAKPSYIDDADYVDLPNTGFSYAQYKSNRIENYYANRDLDPSIGVNQSIKAFTTREFDQRNIGTAANMIGINNGFSLKVQGAVTDADGVDHSYYGPATGVIEIKLLTLAKDEGGGYIFALNQHDDPNHFLQSTGNFIFPGAAYLVSEHEDSRYNYINDDCFPLGQGWDKYYGWAGHSSAMGPRTPVTPSPAPDVHLHASLVESDAGHGDCNDLQPIHYWYVNGTKYYYNVTLTAYTFNESVDFSTDNIDQLVYLYGTQPGTNLSVNNVVWSPSTNTTPDIPNLEKDYRLYLSVDKDPIYFHDLNPESDYYNRAFITTVPRSDFNTTDGTTDTSADPSVDANVINHYADTYIDGTGTEVTIDNMPMLGVSLRDNVDNSTKAYYDEYLREPEKVRIELVTDGEQPFTYVVNLTIKYLLGPTINGNPVIENCALPGEYIFANSFGVDVLIDDDNMAITGRNWYLVAPEYRLTEPDDYRKAVEGINNPDPDKFRVGIDLADYKFDSDRQIHIPAYRYLDGWHLIYEIVANNMHFYLGAKVDPDDPIQAVRPYHEDIEVHNYHRMRPYNGTAIKMDADRHPITDAEGNFIPDYEDLQLTAGARIYIEDDTDMAYFFEWLTKLQDEPTRHAPNGMNIDPQYADSLNIFLMNDVKMPDIASENTSAVESLRFRGVFHGNGHSIDMGTNRMFLGTNEGMFYNTGFITGLNSANNDAEVTVFGDNRLRMGKDEDNDDEVIGGHIENCFLYNSVDPSNGFLIKQANRTNGSFFNCYRTSDNDSKELIDGLTVGTLNEFHYGEVAYNLNRFYLHKRYNLGTSRADGKFVAPVKRIYHDGEYRFAEHSDDGIATALRTYDIPNYRDYLGKRLNIIRSTYGPVTGFDATHHNALDTEDTPRAQHIEHTTTVYDPETGTEVEHTYVETYYEPNYPQDYMFFGQHLTYDEDADIYPTTYTDANRVYRASGYYGSDTDHGFHFNADAQLVHPDLTAVDFTGYRDRQIAVALGDNPNNYYQANYTGFHRNGSTMTAHVGSNMHDLDTVDIEQYIFYPPALDMPEAGLLSLTTTTLEYDLKQEDVPQEREVTRNVLIYVPAEADGDYGAPFTYTEATDPLGIFGHLIHSQFDPEGKVLTDDAHLPQAELLHLVDRENFNCPIAFTVTDRTWYTRDPEDFSSGNNAWEGLFLPFTVRYVDAEISQGGNPLLSHGQLSHFYGHHFSDDPDAADYKGANEADSHEYWLRKFTDVGTLMVDGLEQPALFFDRPQSEDDEANNPSIVEETREYFYSNPYFSVAYGNYYGDDTTHARDQYTATGKTYYDYPMITRHIPYITSYPGPFFREFDLSGEFFSLLTPGTTPIAQRIHYVSDIPTVIDVTDDADIKSISHDAQGGGTYTLRGTYMRTYTGASSGGLNPDDKRSSFKRALSGDDRRIDPFRIYLELPGPSPAPVHIAARIYDRADEGDNDDRDSIDGSYSDLELYIDNNDLLIVSPYDEPIDLPLYDTGGRLLRYLRVNTGENRYADLNYGTYVTAQYKFHIF